MGYLTRTTHSTFVDQWSGTLDRSASTKITEIRKKIVTFKYLTGKLVTITIHPWDLRYHTKSPPTEFPLFLGPYWV